MIARRIAYHGTTLGALSLTGIYPLKTPFEPLMPGVHFIEAGDIAGAAHAIARARTATVIVEPVQGEGGVRPLAAAYLDALRKLAHAADALLIFDEVQCGLGRTGQLFAYQTVDVEPDLLTLAKPLAGGLPMGAVLLTERVAAAIQPGDHATTFGGGPLVASVALEVVRRIAEPSFLRAVQERGAQLAARLTGLRALPAVRDTRGIGLMWGVELDTEAAPVVARALEAGLLLTSAGERVIRLLPPLVISADEIEHGVAVLRDALS
jgi:acetylornithine/succinyldiaminopimelate/putrescine aminotransferase